MKKNSFYGEELKETKNLTSKNRRRNAKIYPIYKMFSWDFLFFYAIEFLFYITTKGLADSQVLVISGLYILFKLIMFIPATAISDIFGKRKSIILGNVLWCISLIVLIYLPGFISVLLFHLICALGTTLKSVSESNLLYDSVSTKGGDGLYTKLDSKGSSWYYLFDGIASFISGYLFVMNQYLPIYICLGLITTATIISLFFKEIYEPKALEKDSVKKVVKDYINDLKVSTKFIKKSRRMKSYILFGAVFYGIVKIFDTYESDLLVDLGVPDEQYSMIFAVLTFIGGMSVKLISELEKRFKNRILTVLSLVYIVGFVLVGYMVTRFTGSIILPLVLLIYSFSKMSTSIWWVLEYKYLKHFTESEMRNKITLTYELVSCVVASIIAMLGGLLLEFIGVRDAILVVGLVSLIIIILILDYMRTRFGLKPEEYKKEDIEFIETEGEKVTNE